MNAHDHDIIHRLREFLELEPGAAATQHAMERTSYALQNRVADTPEQRLLIMRTRIIMFSQVAACIAALLVIGGMLFWGVPQIVGTSVALGEVLEKMKASRSVTFDAVLKITSDRRTKSKPPFSDRIFGEM